MQHPDGMLAGGATVAPQKAPRTRHFSLTGQKHPSQRGSRLTRRMSKSPETIAERVAFQAPIPSETAIHLEALNKDVTDLVLSGYSQISASTNVETQWGRELFRLVEGKIEEKQSKPKPAKRSRWLFNKLMGEVTNEEKKYLVRSPSIDRLPAEVELEDLRLAEDNGSPTGSTIVRGGVFASQKVSPASFIMKEGSFAVKQMTNQFRDLVRQATVVPEGTEPKVERVHYRARNGHMGSVLSQKQLPLYESQWVFRMNVQDTKGKTAFSWSQWVFRRLRQTHNAARQVFNTLIEFHLPNDFRELEGLSVLDYLDQYCIVSSNRTVIYEKIYSKLRVTFVRGVDIRQCAYILLHQHATESMLDEFIELLDLPEDYVFRQRPFSLCLALCDRLYANLLLNDPDVDEKVGQHDGYEEADVENWGFQAGPVERLDFRGVGQRLEGFNVAAPLKRLLMRLEECGESQVSDFPPPRRHREFNMNYVRRFRKMKNKKNTIEDAPAEGNREHKKTVFKMVA